MEAITGVEQMQKDVALRILHARKVLVTEAIGIFGISNDGGMWSIAGLDLPDPVTMRGGS
jgi:hypothetical protein